MTHPAPDQLTRVLTALARIKAGDGGAPGLREDHKALLHHAFVYVGAVEINRLNDALAHLLDVCMGVMGWARFKHDIRSCTKPEWDRADKPMWFWIVKTGSRVEQTEDWEADYAPTHLSAAIEVVCAIADVVGEKEGGTDEGRS